MMRWMLIWPLAALASPALGQTAARFPIDQSYKAISISGFDVQNKGLSLLVSRGSSRDELKGSGNAGCNSWTAAVILRDDQIDFADIVTTKKMCGKPEMKVGNHQKSLLRPVQRAGGISGEFDPGDRERAIG